MIIYEEKLARLTKDYHVLEKENELMKHKIHQLQLLKNVDNPYLDMDESDEKLMEKKDKEKLKSETKE